MISLWSCLSPRSKGWNMLEAEVLIMPVTKKSIPQSRGYVAGISMGWGYELSQVEVKNSELLFIFRGRPQNVPEIWCKPFSFRRTRAFCRMPPPTELFLVLHQETSESFVVSAYSGRITKNLIIIFWQEMRGRKKRLAFLEAPQRKKNTKNHMDCKLPLATFALQGWITTTNEFRSFFVFSFPPLRLCI